jgi:hypothetical protein
MALHRQTRLVRRVERVLERRRTLGRRKRLSNPTDAPTRHHPAPRRIRLGWKQLGVVLTATVLLLAALLLARAWPHRAAPSIDAYRGLASWVDVYEGSAWANPDAVVKDMKRHGVRTLFLQTGNSNSSGALFNRPAEEAFIRAAHARGMKVVAWYLPDMLDATHDYDRIAQAINLRTSDGQHFDSFSLDIESTAIADESARNSALEVLSRKVRALVGASYALGAIIPSPVAVAKQAGFWDTFPYQSVAGGYDVVLPMGYYTFHGTGPSAARADALASMRILRAQPGCSTVPVHLIGGLAEKSTAADVSAFAAATQISGCVGASLYSWTGTTAAEWRALRNVAAEQTTGGGG